MTQRDKRMGAQDILNKSDNLLFGKKSSFEEAFPEIDTIRIEYEESGRGVDELGTRGNRRTAVLTNKNMIGEFLRCSNKLCYNGGVRIGFVIRSMVRERKTESEDSDICQGNEGSPKGRKIYRKCMNFFKYKIAITYVPEK